jgi:DNA-binding CsgD family transcriptional regulator
MRTYAEIAEAARAANDEGILARTLADAQHLVDLVATAPGNPFAERKVMVKNRGYRLSWQAELTRLHGESDAAAWAQAVTAWDNLGRPFRAAYARWRRAEAILAQRGSRAEASQLLRDAVEQSGEHVPLNAALRELARIARVDLVSATPEPVATTAPGRERFGLTEREQEVLRLVAQGKTNAEIGKALYISTKTASVHVTNILRKLDVSSRVMAATKAQRSGLLDD